MNKRIIKSALIIFFFGVAFQLSGQTASGAKALEGKWLSQNSHTITQIYAKDDSYLGRIYWHFDPFDNEGNPLTDINNPDPRLRKRRLVGLNIIKDLKYSGDNTWTGGEIYHPKTGKTYSCKMKMLHNGTLEVTAYIGLVVFGKSVIWSRKNE